MIILDTDVFSLAELEDSPEYRRVHARIAQLDPPEEVVTTVITCEEQARGRLARIAAARTDAQLVSAYANYRQHVLNYQSIPIIEFNAAASRVMESLRGARIRAHGLPGG